MITVTQSLQAFHNLRLIHFKNAATRLFTRTGTPDLAHHFFCPPKNTLVPDQVPHSLCAHASGAKLVAVLRIPVEYIYSIDSVFGLQID